MKKILLFIFLFILSTNIRAQFYIGGSVGMGLVKQYASEKELTFKIIPEIGYQFNNKWATGLSLGYKKGACMVGSGSYNQNVSLKSVGIQPYVRYSIYNSDAFRLFTDGIFTYENIKDKGTNMNLGLSPGVSFLPTKHFAVVARLGFFGMEIFKSKGRDEKSGIGGVELDSNNITFGMLYIF